MTVAHSNDVTTTISCVPKMAESVRKAERNRNNKIRLMSENGEFLSGNSEKVIEENSLNNLKSLFYLSDVENNCFSKYSVSGDGVNRASEFCPDVDGFSSDYKGICPNNDENCRKKRCSDRYDSSESSDSGIAVSSSASSGTSDITDPGSPFSTSSDDSSSSPRKCKVGKRCKSEEKSTSWSQPTGRCRSEEKTWTESWQRKEDTDKTDHNFITPETDFKMAPNIPSASSPCGLWTSITGNNTANDTAHYNHFDKTQSEAISNKRLNKVDAKDLKAPLNINNNIVVNVPSPILSETESDSIRLRIDKSSKKKNRSVNCENAKVKMRRTSQENAKIIVKETTDVLKTNKNGVKNFEKSVGCVAKPKQDINRHQGKITEYFKSQIKSIVGMKRDYGLKKDGNLSIKAKTAVPDEEEPPSKKNKPNADEKSQSDGPVFVKPSPKIIETVMPFAEPNKLLSQLSKLPKAADFLLKKPAGTKTLFNKILQNHKNRKLAESYLKCRTVLKPKPAVTAVAAAVETEASKPSQKPYENSIRNNNLTEMPNIKVEELSSNLENKDKKVQNINALDSNLLSVGSNVKTDVKTNCEVISSCSTESDSSKLPILSVPKTIRFPAIGHNNRVDKHRTTRETISCRWDACSVQFDSASGLLEHLQTAHVLIQVCGEKFVCLWVGCKVFDQKSCSRTWLERHVLSHAGNKPYRCIVDGCGQGFSTQAILERHVNNHFAVDVKKALDNSIVHKLFRRNGKKLRYRRQPWSARMFDFFDAGIMEGLEHRLVQLTKARTGGDIADIPGKSFALTSQVIARRMTENGKQQFLLRWFPPNVVDDEWVFENEITKKKIVSIPNLSPMVSSTLQETLESVTKSCQSYRKGRRKIKKVIPSDIEEAVVLASEVEEKPKEQKELSEPQQTIQEDEEIKETKEEKTVTPEKPVEPQLPPPKKVSNKKIKVKSKKKDVNVKSSSEKATFPNSLPPVGCPSSDVANSSSLTTEKTVSLRPKEEGITPAALPEEMSMVPICPPTEEVVPIHTNGIIMDNTKLIAPPVKTEMIVGSPLKLVTSQYIEQPFVQAVMPLQMPVTYQIPIVKLSQTSGMFFPQIPNYIIPPSPPMFPISPLQTFRNGFHFSTTGTIQIQASSTTLQQTASGFMQSTNTSGFQIVQSPTASIQQSVVTAFQNSGIANLNLKSPTLRLLNCQPLILNNAKPLTNVSMTLTNMSSIADPNASALTVPTGIATGMPIESNSLTSKTNILPGSQISVSPTTPKKLIKHKLNILPKPHLTPKSGVSDGSKSKEQCLQSCGPATGTST